MSLLVGRKILNEILSSDHRDLRERVEGTPSAVNIVGVCGESPAHIAIYKHDLKMLTMLLAAGADPNLPNSEGNTVVHLSAMFGYFDCTQLLYFSNKCDLELKNHKEKTALEIAQSKADTSVLYSLKSFADYICGEADEAIQLEEINRGRSQCANFLAEKVVFDREEKVRQMVQATLNANMERRRKARIIRGVGGMKRTTFHSDLTYNSDINVPAWEKKDMEFFQGYHDGVRKIVTTMFACDYISNSVHVGYHNVLLRERCKMPDNVYHEPPVQSRLQEEMHSPPPPPPLPTPLISSNTIASADEPTEFEPPVATGFGRWEISNSCLGFDHVVPTHFPSLTAIPSEDFGLSLNKPRTNAQRYMENMVRKYYGSDTVVGDGSTRICRTIQGIETKESENSYNNESDESGEEMERSEDKDEDKDADKDGIGGERDNGAVNLKPSNDTVPSGKSRTAMQPLPAVAAAEKEVVDILLSSPLRTYSSPPMQSRTTNLSLLMQPGGLRRGMRARRNSNASSSGKSYEPPSSA